MRPSIAAANRASIVLLAGMLAGCSNISPDSQPVPLVSLGATESVAGHSGGSVQFAYRRELGLQRYFRLLHRRGQR